MQKFLAFFRTLFSRRGAMRLLYAIALLATLWAAFCIEERWRGRRAWQSYRSAAVARGIPVELEGVLPPNLAAADNFAAIPMIQELFRAQEAHEPTPVWFSALKLNSSDTRTPVFRAFEAPSLVAWRDHFVREGVIPAAGENPASDVLLALEKVEPEMAQLREAGKRKGSKFPVHWELGFAAGVPHLIPLRQAVNLYQLKMVAHLERGESAAAYSDFRDGLRIFTALRGELALISGLVRISMIESLAVRVREGIASGKWRAPELEKLQADFAGLKIADDWRLALNSERAVLNTAASELHGKSDRALAQFLDEVMNSDRSHSTSAFGVGLYPRGWLWLSQRKINEYFDRSIERVDAIAGGKPFVLPNDASIDVARLKSSGAFAKLPYFLYVALTPAMENVENSYLHCLAVAAQAQLACALDRHRLTKGSYPEQLGSLQPEFIAALPPDPVSQAPMLYRKTPDGFQLWSVALNRLDESAVELPGKAPKNQPDWVWRR
jgi:hypothetical protein